MTRFAATLLLCLALPAGAQGDPAILQLRILQGEGAVYAAGGRATRGVIVQVTDETGKPVAGATVSFRLPESGPSGVFAAGGRTEIVETGADGRAEVWGMAWNRETGPLEMRVVAAKGATRGGTVVPLYLTAAAALTPERDAAPEHKVGGSRKTLWIAVALAAAASVAVAGLAAKPAAAAAAAASAPQIQPPTITLGRP